MNDTIRQELVEIIKVYLPSDASPDEITDEMHLITDLKINSTDIVDIVIDIEDKYDIEIEDDAVGEMNTVHDAIKLITHQLDNSKTSR